LGKWKEVQGGSSHNNKNKRGALGNPNRGGKKICEGGRTFGSSKIRNTAQGPIEDLFRGPKTHFFWGWGVLKASVTMLEGFIFGGSYPFR